MSIVPNGLVVDTVLVFQLVLLDVDPLLPRFPVAPPGVAPADPAPKEPAEGLAFSVAEPAP